MKIYLAGILQNGYIRNKVSLSFRDYYLLESYYYIRNNKNYNSAIIKSNPNFLLDSGGFTYIHDKDKNCDWEQYVLEYAEFINKNDIINFFELDIDNIVGIEKVEYYRSILEKKTKKQCIPVWHKSRGKEYFIQMCKEYKYIAIGGLITDGFSTTKIAKYLPWFINTAHDNNCMIHGLGFTNMNLIPFCCFDSVDSTTWNMCVKYGELMKFEKNRIVRYQSIIKGIKCRKIKNVKEATIFNLEEWLKFQQYAKKNL